ncbi:MAG TPA: transglycosylase SLT domain-containing protein [Chloroflexota bacterium]|nr:transglycosylase SLT domain-containing protein [Chloroflexota bacterium]
MTRARFLAAVLLLSVPFQVMAQEEPEVVLIEEVVYEVQEAPLARPLSIPELIDAAAYRYGISAARMACIVQRESGGNPWAYNWRDGSMGLLQWQPRTWAWASWQAGVGGASPYDAAASIQAGAWLMSRGGWSHWSVERFCR